jgi:NAD(P)H-nitrite reductase
VALCPLTRGGGDHPRRPGGKRCHPRLRLRRRPLRGGRDGHVTGAVDPNGDRYDGAFCGVAIGLEFNTEWLRGTGIETDDGVVVDEYMQTGVEDIYAAGDITRFYDSILGEHGQNGSWGSAKEQGAVAATNMVADADEEAFRWVSSYSITHFDFPFLSFGHPTVGDDSAERKYSDTEWRRLAFKNGRIVGGVLIGDLSQQQTYKQLIREEREVADQKDVLLEEDVDLDKLDAAHRPRPSSPVSRRSGTQPRSRVLRPTVFSPDAAHSRA